jgi:anaerobic ribonucleoside-triphosphate reductase activating protein
LVKEVAERILDLRNVIEGVSISGGEPFQQKPALIDFLRIIRTSSTLSTLVFTGYTRRELEEIDPRGEALDNIDLLIAGRYRSSHHSATRLLGSANQKIYYLTDRYDPADIAAVPEAEVWLNPDGSIALSGITPLDWDTGKAG